MSEPDNFLSRWSRRKTEAGNIPAGTPPLSDKPQAAHPDAVATPERPPLASGPAFDPASLPPIDSIGADTDIAAFLKPGVPDELRHAALRRAWSMDPAIRDFKGLQENDWNFNDPNGIPGFGELSPNTDVKKMLGQMFGGPDVKDKDDPVGASAGAIEASGPGGVDAESAKSLPDDRIDLVDDVATQHKPASEPATPLSQRRTHGRALPQ